MMNKGDFTLKQISDDMNITVKALRDHIHKGTLIASKVGRQYMVTSENYDKFSETTNRFPTREYLCEKYKKCLDKAALLNISLDCENCPMRNCNEDSRYEILLAPYHWQNAYQRK